MDRQGGTLKPMASAPDWPCAPIEQALLIHGQVPADCRFSYGTQLSAPFTLVKLQSSGSVGWGEIRIAPDPQMFQAADAMVGVDASKLDVWLAEYFDLKSPQRMWAEAFSMAGHDLVARSAGAPLYQRFGETVRKHVPLMPCLFPENPEHAARKARAFTECGARHLKLKLYGNLDKDLNHLAAVRSVAGESVTIQGDANRGYIFRELLEDGLSLLRGAGLDVFEDPCDGTAEQYAELRSLGESKIMLDVDARSNARLESFLAADACDMVNLHPCQQGTLSNALARANVCRGYDVQVMVGGTGFIGIGTAAYHHLAGCIGTSLPCGEVGGNLDHGMPPDLVDGTDLHPASITLKDTPGYPSGHGAVPDFAELDRYVIGRFQSEATESCITRTHQLEIS